MVAAAFVVLLIFSIKFPKSRKVAIAAMALMWTIYCFGDFNGDMLVYEKTYNSIVAGGSASMEIGYVFLMKVFAKLGLSFRVFRCFLGTAYTLLLYNAIRRFTKYEAIAMTLMIVFPTLFFVFAVRSGIAMAIIMNAIPYLYEGKRYGWAKYIALILLATTIHKTALLFVILLLTTVKYSKKIIAALLIVTAALGFILASTNGFEAFIQTHLAGIPGIGYFGASGDGANLTGAAVSFVVLYSNLLIALVINIPEEIEFGVDKKYLIGINSMVLIAMSFTLVVMAMNFMRLAYTMFPFFMALYCNKVMENGFTFKRIHVARSLSIACLILCVVAWLLYVNGVYLMEGTATLQGIFNIKLCI